MWTRRSLKYSLDCQVRQNVLEPSEVDIQVLLDLNIIAVLFQSIKNSLDVYDILISAI